MSQAAGALTIREAAAFLGTHEQTVRRLARRGAIPSFKVGRDWRFHPEALLRWTESQGQARRERSVLVIDDEEAVCRATAETVRRLGYGVRTALTAREGLDMVVSGAPDLILLDLLMPGMNGPQFLEKLRTTHPMLPVVIVTGYPDSVLMSEAMRHPPVMLLSKPLDGEALERTLFAILGERT